MHPFQPVHSYVTGVPVPVPTLARHEVAPRVGYTFDVGAGYPSLPLRAHGEVARSGGPPFRYAVDAEGEAWRDDARGGALRPVNYAELLSVEVDERTDRELRAALGLSPRDPAWMAEATAHGWSPSREVPEALEAKPGPALDLMASASGDTGVVRDLWTRRLSGSRAWLIHVGTRDKHVDVSLTSDGPDRIVRIVPEDATSLEERCDVRVHLPGEETWRMETFWSYEARDQVRILLVPHSVGGGRR